MNRGRTSPSSPVQEQKGAATGRSLFRFLKFVKRNLVARDGERFVTQGEFLFERLERVDDTGVGEFGV
jgi:hypothetical protein